MKNKMILVFMIVLLLTVYGCTQLSQELDIKKSDTTLKDTLNKCKTLNPSFCNKDSDCICGGKDKITGNCFIGNIDYYELCVSKDDVCPDFCSGINGKLKVICKNNQCVQI